MLIGIVYEGATDFVVLDAVAAGVVAGAACRPIHPNFDALQPGEGTGWQAVRKFLKKSGPALSLGAYDLIVIQVDASIRHLEAIRQQNLREPADGEAELTPLCDHVKGWVTGGVPPGGIIVLPREDIEAWLLAASSHVKEVEKVEDATEELAARNLLQRDADGKPIKGTMDYSTLAQPLVLFVRDPRRLPAVPELERFVGKLREQSRRVRQAKKGHEAV